MTKAELARQAAIERVGDAYVYGAWDQQCTVANRNRYANLNTEYRDAIKNQCQRTKSNKSTCSGCKYDGKRIHDCRGLTSICAKAAGIVIDGQTVARQWNADVWAEKGTIDTLPKDLPYVQLFRYNGSKWAHTGCYIGNGETVDARGHASGVVRCKLTAYSWTHWAIPKGMYDKAEAGGEIVELDTMYTATVVTKSGSLNMRSGPGKAYAAFKSIPKGDTVEVLMEHDNGWDFVRWNGTTGYVSAEYLAPGTPTITIEPPESPTEPPEKPVVDIIKDSDTAQIRANWGVFLPALTEDDAVKIASAYPGAILMCYGQRKDKPPDTKGE